MRNARHGLVAAGALSMVLLVSSPAAADALRETAKELFNKASVARDAGAWEECYARAKAAWAIQKHPKIAGALGDCALKVNKPGEAAEFLTYYLEHRSEAARPELVTLIEQHLAEAKAQIVVVRIETNVDGARVLVDGELASLGEPLYLAAGKHRFEASRPGYLHVDKQQDMPAGSDEVIRLELVPAPEGAMPEVPEVPVETVRPLWPLFVFGGVAVVGVGVGIAGVVLSGGARSDADALTFGAGGCDAACNDELAGLLDDEATFGTVGVVGFVGAGVALASGVVLHLALPREPVSGAKREQGTLWLAPTARGAVVGGTF